MSIGVVTIGCVFMIAGVLYLAPLMFLPVAYIMGMVLLVLAVGFLTSGKSIRGANSSHFN